MCEFDELLNALWNCEGRLFPSGYFRTSLTEQTCKFIYKGATAVINTCSSLTDVTL